MTLNKDQFLDRFYQFIENKQSIAILAHQYPDDDAFSSVLSLRRILANKYPDKQFQVLFESEVSRRWDSFPDYQYIETTENINTDLAQADCYIFLDGNQYFRFTDFQDQISDLTGTKICIDHHSSPADDWDLLFISKQSTATAEIIYDLFYESPDPDLAQLLLVGILGDTGNLLYVSHEQSQVFAKVQSLVDDAQIQIQVFKSKYDYFSAESISIAKELIKTQQVVEIPDWPRANFAHVPTDLAKQYTQNQIKEGVTLYQSSFNMIEQGINWSLTLYPSDKGVKISARSIMGCVNVRRLMEVLELGGGHNLAAGGVWTGESDPEMVIQELTQKLKQMKPELVI